MSERAMRRLRFDVAGASLRLADFGDDTAAVIAARSTACLVVGASLGGFAAIDALRHEAARRAIAGLVLVDVLPDPDPTRVRGSLAARFTDDSQSPLVDDILGQAGRLRRRIASSPVPVTLVRATRSALSDDEVGRLADVLPALMVVDIEAGHLVARDAPVELAEVIGGIIDATQWPAPPSI